MDCARPPTIPGPQSNRWQPCGTGKGRVLEAHETTASRCLPPGSRLRAAHLYPAAREPLQPSPHTHPYAHLPASHSICLAGTHFSTGRLRRGPGAIISDGRKQ